MPKTYKASARPKMRPGHPGAILRDDVLPALGISVSEAARELGISRQTLHQIMAEKAPITPAMALRIGKFCGNGPGIWLRLQVAYDLWRAEEEIGTEIAAIRTRKAA
jgi:addiction module HigA family antidote